MGNWSKVSEEGAFSLTAMGQRPAGQGGRLSVPISLGALHSA